MKIIITESQVALIRRLSELEHYLDIAIKELNEDINEADGRNKPNNFGVYEGWVMSRTKWDFEINNPNLEFPSHDFNMLVSGQFNNKIRKGFNKVKNRR